VRRAAYRSLLLVTAIGAVAVHGLLPAAASTIDEESCFVSAINSARASAGVGSLGVNGALVTMARTWSATMAAAGQIYHNPNLTTLAPSNWLNLGENVGVGPTCDALAQAFMNSPEHRANILDPAFSTVGVGVVDTADGTIYVTEDFMGTGAAPATVVTAPAPAPVVTAPAPKPPAPVATQAAPAPVSTHTAPAPAAAHAAAPAPKPVAPAPSTPAPQPSSPTPDASASPDAATAEADIPTATPIVDEVLTVQGDQLPQTAPTAGAPPQHHGILHSVLQAISSFFAHLL